MLLIQSFHLSWDKKQRGAPYAEERSHMAKSSILPKDFFRCRKDNPLFYPCHIVSEHCPSGYISYEEKSDRISLDGIEVIKQNGFYEVRYRFDFLNSYNNAVPKRKKYNKENHIQELLNEEAFRLYPNEYGRITHNAKYHGEGQPWYKMWVYNMLYLDDDTAPLDILVTRTPEKIYEQMAMLY
jgi:hypothetical protein